MQYPPSPPPPPGPPQPPEREEQRATTDHGETVLFTAYPAATPVVWLKWLVTLGIFEFFRRHTVFLVTNRRVVVRQGVVHRTERSVPVSRIQDISTRTGLFTGAVELSSAGGALGVESFGPLWKPSVARMSEAIEQLVAQA